ncbi:zinc-dependent alcohol dehydrogenase family protein [Asticcacaulis sp. EMRT-3]|uniref:zinc-dependent alcohol dehydrogenase family protein n=1 Tax=Asticcacaulis sp. EMRT-3 TaxID=3040349 RepID=UPI0024AFF7E6|nr:zinc-dependent alcohol dehydrogenase family protein [Asticcacaulis sp. EMRT-3]MDI7776479.1 zinc-dependent alcohol dehydrogenase family protein [Asticcacaulis sp. EMRT-3]
MRAALLPTAQTDFIVTELAKPEPKSGQVLVRIVASGVNPLDTKIRAGGAAHARQPLPAVLGMDLAGVVEAIGEGVTDFKLGDDVFGMATGIGGQQGSQAEFAAVDADFLALKPASLDFRQAAALPLVVITAWEGLVDHAHVQPGQTVLVQGGAGGVGHVAVQIAKALGATVYATASQKDFPYLTSLGAIPVDRDLPVADMVARYASGEGFDIVYDTVGGAAIDAAFEAVKCRGHVTSALGREAHNLAPLSLRAATYSAVFTLLPLLTGKGRKHHGDILREIARQADAGKLVPRLDPRRFGLSDVTAAHEAVTSQPTGKVIIDIA